MTIKTFYFNPYRECTYLVWEEQQGVQEAQRADNEQDTDAAKSLRLAVIVDAGMYGEAEERRFREFLDTHRLSPIALLITHAHPDHVCGVDFIQRTYGIEPIILPEEGLLQLNNTAQVSDNQSINKAFLSAIADITVLHTPGHKEDCVCYYWPSQHCIFTGDTLFQESIGRTDLPGGDMPTLIRSLQRLTALPDDTTVYPGHGYPTTIGHEKQYNPYL